MSFCNQDNNDFVWSQIKAQRQRVNEKKVFVTELQLNPPAKDIIDEEGVMDEWLAKLH